MLQIKRRLPKVNRDLAAHILDNEKAEAEDEKKDTDGNETKKTSKKKKGLSSEVLKDERFAKMFEIKVWQSDQLETWLIVVTSRCEFLSHSLSLSLFSFYFVF